MADYLVFRLYGPMASWGEIAVGESRHSAVYPSRSALVGLLGAALGIRRDEDDAQEALAHGYRFGIQMISAGAPLRDYHTVQAPPRRRNVRYRTRREEIADTDALSTLLSMREYRCDALAVIAVEAAADALWTLQQLQEALFRPQFTLYLGRKSCPPALPLGPQIVSADCAGKAFEQARQPSLLALLHRNPDQAWPTRDDLRVLRPGNVRYYGDDGMDFGMTAQMQLMRHDQPISRRRWQFAPRREWVYWNDEEAQ